MQPDQQIIWNQLNTSDLEGAIAFYEGLFGWTTKPEERATYVHFYMGDEAVAGCMPLMGGPGVPPHWSVHVGTSDIGAYAERARAAGGRELFPCMDIPHVGKLHLFADPGGACLMAYQPEDMDRPIWGNRNELGHFCWVELMCRDAARSLEFYRKVVGWQTSSMDMGDKTYHMLAVPGAAPGEAIGGAMQNDFEEVPDHWLPYVRVESAQAAYDRALELGGKAYVPPKDIPGYGRFSVLADPQGGVFAVFQMGA
ncbi:MAG: VOC family protein [Planctomycetota bacterium]